MLRFIILALTTAVVSAQNAGVQDISCTFTLLNLRCEPSALCALQPQPGDITPEQMCRVRSNASKMPQQQHLAYAGATAGTGMTVSWATYDKVADSTVWLGSSNYNLQLRTDIKTSSVSYYQEGNYSLYQYHATITGLTPNTKYYYKVGSAGDTTCVSAVSSFTTARAASDNTTFDMAIYGNLGYGDKGDMSVKYLNSLSDKLSFVYHLGDISYADEDFLVPSQSLGFFYEKVYNKWMNSLTPLMSKVPYMVTVGDQDTECHSPACLVSKFKTTSLSNYTAYNARFKMPSADSKGTKNMWYSFEYGPIHFTTISSETDYPNFPIDSFAGKQTGGFGDQLAWLEADLKKAAANRANVPWIMVGMHRPIYHRKGTDEIFRPTGYSLALQQALEALFIKYGVDVVFAAHENSYERHFPIVKSYPVLDGVSYDMKTYTNPKAPVYIVSGGPGNPELNALSGKKGMVTWNVLESAEYGISTIRVARDSLTLKYVATSDQKVVDEFVITKNVSTPTPSSAPSPSPTPTPLPTPAPSKGTKAPTPSTTTETPKPSTATETPKPSTATEAPKPTAGSEAQASSTGSEAPLVHPFLSRLRF